MSRSPFFARIKRDVLTIIATVPPGRVVTFKDIGQWLDVAPRHVAYILSRLDAGQASGIPWHRAVPEIGVIDVARRDANGMRHSDALQAEGVTVATDGRILDLGRKVIAVADLPHGLPPQTRPADAPVAPAKGPGKRPR